MQQVLEKWHWLQTLFDPKNTFATSRNFVQKMAGNPHECSICVATATFATSRNLSLDVAAPDFY
jgi:hypothetical protein